MFGLGQDSSIQFFLVFLRVGAAIAILPVVGERSVPNRIRLVMAFVFTAVVMPAVTNQFEQPSNLGWGSAKYMVTETITGLMLGLSLRMFVFALQIAGSIAAQSTSLSQLFGTAAVDPQPAIGHVFVISGLALAVTLGLHLKIAELLIGSYQLFQPGSLIPAIDLSPWGVTRFAHAFGLAFSLAAPFMIASLIYNIALGAINRAMPQLMVSFVGAPAITAGGLVLLFVVAPLILSAWWTSLDTYMQAPFGTSP
ncbi:MAG: flagellar biosynthetic protein FliR [Paracoccaceae bacterium]